MYQEVALPGLIAERHCPGCGNPVPRFPSVVKREVQHEPDCPYSGLPARTIVKCSTKEEANEQLRRQRRPAGDPESP